MAQVFTSPSAGDYIVGSFDNSLAIKTCRMAGILTEVFDFDEGLINYFDIHVAMLHPNPGKLKPGIRGTLLPRKGTNTICQIG